MGGCLRPRVRRTLIGAGLSLSLLTGCSSTPDELEVTWEGEGCRYSEAASTVTVTLLATGTGSAEVTVTATVDEDTTVPVGSMTRTVTADGEEQTLDVAFTVSRAPFVDVDGVAACTLQVEPVS